MVANDASSSDWWVFQVSSWLIILLAVKSFFGGALFGANAGLAALETNDHGEEDSCHNRWVKQILLGEVVPEVIGQLASLLAVPGDPVLHLLLLKGVVGFLLGLVRRWLCLDFLLLLGWNGTVNATRDRAGSRHRALKLLTLLLRETWLLSQSLVVACQELVQLLG